MPMTIEEHRQLHRWFKYLASTPLSHEVARPNVYLFTDAGRRYVVHISGEYK